MKHGRYGEGKVASSLICKVSDEAGEVFDTIWTALEQQGCEPDDIEAICYPTRDSLDVADGLVVDALRGRGVTCATAFRCYGYVMDTAVRVVRDYKLNMEFLTPALSSLDWT